MHADPKARSVSTQTKLNQLLAGIFGLAIDQPTSARLPTVDNTVMHQFLQRNSAGGVRKRAQAEQGASTVQLEADTADKGSSQAAAITCQMALPDPRKMETHWLEARPHSDVLAKAQVGQCIVAVHHD
jgi:hypothetical protein